MWKFQKAKVVDILVTGPVPILIYEIWSKCYIILYCSLKTYRRKVCIQQSGWITIFLKCGQFLRY